MQKLAWILGGLAGVVLAAGVTYAASSLSTQRIGISSEPVSAGRELAPRATVTPTPTPAPRKRRKPRPKRTPTPTPQPTRTAIPTAVPTVDDHGGGSDDHGGRGGGHGSDD
jgi:hypothetical protein